MGRKWRRSQPFARRIAISLTCRAGSRPLDGPQGLGSSSVLEEPVLRPWQTEILAQRLALILGAENAAPLQLRHHLVDEVVEPGGEEGKHDVETVAAVAGQP